MVTNSLKNSVDDSDHWWNVTTFQLCHFWSILNEKKTRVKTQPLWRRETLYVWWLGLQYRFVDCCTKLRNTSNWNLGSNFVLASFPIICSTNRRILKNGAPFEKITSLGVRKISFSRAPYDVMVSVWRIGRSRQLDSNFVLANLGIENFCIIVLHSTE